VPQPAAVDAYGSGVSGGPFFPAAPDDPFAPRPPAPPSHRDIASEILSAYGGGGGPPPPGGGPGGYYPGPGGGAPAYGGANGGYGGVGGPPGALALENGDSAGAVAAGLASPSSLTMSGLAETEDKPVDPYEAALKKLVNVDHIDEPAAEVVKLTMKKKEEIEHKKGIGKSKPKPPAANNVVGSQATLSQIQSVKPAGSSEGPKEGIMKAPPQLWHADAGMAGALVVHGTHPPPLQQPGFVGTGFGAGYNPYAHQQQYYQHQQQQQQPYQQPQQQQYQYR
jgi:hypothetical protein